MRCFARRARHMRSPFRKLFVVVAVSLLLITVYLDTMGTRPTLEDPKAEPVNLLEDNVTGVSTVEPPSNTVLPRINPDTLDLKTYFRWLSSSIRAYFARLGDSPYQRACPDTCGRTTGNGPPVKILLLAYGRSGSSVTGELLAANPHLHFFYEPMYVYRTLQYVKQEQFVRKSSYLLDEVFGCSPHTMAMMAHIRWSIIRKEPIEKTTSKNPCPEDDPDSVMCGSGGVVVKTIRMRIRMFWKWLMAHPNVHVVHLVRDPRAMLYSMSNNKDWHKSNYTNAAMLCRDMAQDLRAGMALPTERYTVVRYEDLVEYPMETTRRLYSRLGLPFGPSTLRFLREHFHVGESTPGPAPTHSTRLVASNRRHRNPPPGHSSSIFYHLRSYWDRIRDMSSYVNYYSTFRNSSFRHDKWRDVMTPELARRLDKVCMNVLEMMNYPRYTETTTGVPSTSTVT